MCPLGTHSFLVGFCFLWLASWEISGKRCSFMWIDHRWKFQSWRFERQSFVRVKGSDNTELSCYTLPPTQHHSLILISPKRLTPLYSLFVYGLAPFLIMCQCMRPRWTEEAAIVGHRNWKQDFDSLQPLFAVVTQHTRIVVVFWRHFDTFLNKNRGRIL